jgi:hypothetical protein
VGEAAIVEAVAALHQAAKEESWPENQLTEWLKRIWASANHLIETVRVAQLDAPIANFVEKMHSLAPVAARRGA